MAAPYLIQKHTNCFEFRVYDPNTNLAKSKFYDIKQVAFHHEEYLRNGQTYQTVEMRLVSSDDILFVMTDNPNSAHYQVGDFCGVNNSDVYACLDIIRNVFFTT
jgi:hypothetical protein